jgi:hypothetical protein
LPTITYRRKSPTLESTLAFSYSTGGDKARFSPLRKCVPLVEVRLVQLLASFIRVGSEYSLARLEYALSHPARPAPPLIDRLPDASEETLRTVWPQIEAQLDAAGAYAKQLARSRGSGGQEDTAAGWLQRTVKELDQYARAIRWVLTVTEKE